MNDKSRGNHNPGVDPDEVLRRMLTTPPEPHKPKKAEGWHKPKPKPKPKPTKKKPA